MAYGILCKHCGHQETDHLGQDVDFHDEHCPGYEPDDPVAEILAFDQDTNQSTLRFGISDRIESNRKIYGVERVLPEIIGRTGVSGPDMILLLLGYRLSR